MGFDYVVASLSRGAFEPVAGRLIVARNKKSGGAVVAVRGRFDREVFSAAACEARAAGLTSIECVVADGPISYDAPRATNIRTDMDADLIDEQLRAARMAAVRSCKRRIT